MCIKSLKVNNRKYLNISRAPNCLACQLRQVTDSPSQSATPTWRLPPPTTLIILQHFSLQTTHPNFNNTLISQLPKILCYSHITPLILFITFYLIIYFYTQFSKFNSYRNKNIDKSKIRYYNMLIYLTILSGTGYEFRLITSKISVSFFFLGFFTDIYIKFYIISS